MASTAEQHQTLWLLTASPVIWAMHFMLSYGTVSIWCAKMVSFDSNSFMPVRVAIAIYTAVSLVAIAFFGWLGYRRHRFGHAELPHDADTPQDRHRFLGFATFLLSSLSGVAVLFAALVVVFFGTCH
jgi:hypothetical protein